MIVVVIWRGPQITFPGYWTNTCCSHPLMRADEKDGEAGARVAARRKLEQELGIKVEDVELESFTFMTKIHYLAPSDDIWGEHEGAPSDPTVAYFG